jgi:hypothetical protein
MTWFSGPMDLEAQSDDTAKSSALSSTMLFLNMYYSYLSEGDNL